MTSNDPEKRGFDRLQKSDRAKAGKPPSAKFDAAPSRDAPERGVAAARRLGQEPPAKAGTASNVDTSASNVDTFVPNVDTRQAKRRNGNDTSNVDTKTGKVGKAVSNVDTKANKAGGVVSNVDTRPYDNADVGYEGDGDLANAARETDRPADLTYDDIPQPKPVFKAYQPKRTPGKTVQPAKSRTFDDVKKSAAEKIAALAPPPESVVLGSAPGVTRTEDTRKQYDRRGRQLEERFHREMGIPSGTPLAPLEFATWFLSMRPELKPSSWRYYKQAVIFHLTRIQSSEAEDAVALIESETAWDSEMDMVGNRATPAKKTKSAGKVVVSATKAQFFDYEDWQRLDMYLRMRVWSKYTNVLRNWLRAGLATGLRPDEWRSTTIMVYEGPDGDRTYLFVGNAKATNGRGNGKVRSIDITDLTEETRMAVEQMSRDGALWQADGVYDSVQNQVSQTLYRADNTLWPARKTRTYALYSCRHQFILNHRSLGLPEDQLSAMLGHMVTDTQMAHYGRRGKGWSPDKILDVAKAHPSEAMTVKKRLDQYVIRRQMDALINVKRRPSRVRAGGDGGETGASGSFDAPGMDEL